MLSKDWDFNIEEHDVEFKDDLRAASGIGKRKKKALRSLIGEGNQAYVDSDLPEAIRIMQEVIRIEPRAASAWSVLAQCYEDTDEPQKALQLRIMAAHLRHDAEEWDRLARHSKDLGYNQQALYCYRKLYRLDPSNVDALWDRACLAKDMGELRTARHSLVAILKRFPHDLTVLNEVRPILIELSELSLCASLYQGAFDHHQQSNSLGRADGTREDNEKAANHFGLLEVLVLADLYNSLGEYEHAINTIRKGCRWLQGRAAQKFWDVCDDDREYDLPGDDGGDIYPRAGDVRPGLYTLDVNARHRLAIARLKLGEIEEGKMHANIVLSQDAFDYGALFGETADAFFELEMYADAGPIYELLGSDAATSSLYVLLQAAVCRRMLGDLREAVDVYQQVIDADPTNNEAKMKLAELYEIMDEPRKALELVYQVIDSRKRRAVQRDEGVKDPSENSQGASLFEEKSKSKAKASTNKNQGRLTIAQLRDLEEQRKQEVMKSYKRVEELWPLILTNTQGEHEEAEREWVLEAEKLVETFRETRNLFLTTRHNPFRGMFPRYRSKRLHEEAEENRMVSRLELIEQGNLLRRSKEGEDSRAKVDFYRGLSFDNWLRIFMQYAFILTKRNQYELADEVLRHIMISNAYRNPDLQDTIRITLITCAMMSRRYTVVVEQCRKLINTHQFNNEPFRILVVALASGLPPTDSFISSTLQKHLFREIKLNDAAIKKPDTLKWNATGGRYVLTTSKAVEGEDMAKLNEGEDMLEEEGEEVLAEEPTDADKNKHPRIPIKDNPMIVAVYGQVCIAAKSYQSAIFYLLHAYDYCPNDPTICLCLAIASIGRAMQRQSDNRHHLIAQGMAFLSQYRTLRKSCPDGLAEVEFNFGRAFQQLGLHTHAVVHYERVLELAETNHAEHGLTKEAAYNLSLIYVTTGAIPLADALYRRWLSL
ncbi:hypothetical protein SERLA73DRAFT_159861 [Serpula lacrymans var. lacrymans S7.3]|uniref:TPR-like protein n=1 Tax=Serpula lacrymans var. lacrymans (strain S7.3) TaxID=936435 RepID=F8PU12_SERL3|nr:hypothetical protein SERLA73DRAFT_159861 [Serpula lacrymans var. lacrymans S7.3]